ncbi:PH and SEC7 domain-containing protein 1 isoform X2 [Pseudophryne corroboree]|uniref:PH and SEC7 domain-containing protein 1 isoform X2 n=1 Tax=Pseudophryne corroboree TaxID=495146 RepID=UPI003081BCAF
MAQTSGVVRFLPEGDCILSSPRALREAEGKPWMQSLDSDEVFSPQRCFSPNLNSRRIQVLRKSLTPEARRAHLGMYNSTGSLVCNVPETVQRSGRITAPCSPLRSSPLYSPGSRRPLVLPQTTGHSSIVTFTFVKKSSVQTLNGITTECDSGQGMPLEGTDQGGECCANTATDLETCHGKNVEGLNGISIKQRVGSPQPVSSPQGGRVQLISDSPQTCQRLSHRESGRESPYSIAGSDYHLRSHCDSPTKYVNTSTPAPSIMPSVNNMPSSPSQSPLLRRLVGQTNFCTDEVTSPIKEGSNEQSPRSPSRLDLSQQVDEWGCPKEASLHAQKIAKAKWEFFYGSPESQRTDLQIFETSSPPYSPVSSNSLRNRHIPAENEVSEHSLCHVEVEIETTSSADQMPHVCETGIIRRTIKYSETDLDSVPLRCYRETNIDDILAENEGLDSAIGSQKDSESNRSITDTSTEKQEPQDTPVVPETAGFPTNMSDNNVEEDEDEVFVSTKMGDFKREAIQTPLQSPLTFLLCHRLSEDGMDSFSKHFEAIMESHRAKGTSYSSLDSIDILSSSAQNQNSFFTFDLPTLTSETQKQICKNAQLIEDNFAPLAHLELDSGTSSTTDSAWSEKEDDTVNATAVDNHPLHSPSPSEDSLIIADAIVHSEPPLGDMASDFDSEMDSTERLALGSTDTLSNGHKADQEAAKRLAKRLYNLDGFKKADVARHLGKNNEFSKMVAEEYLKFFVFTGMSLDQALRMFLKELALMGETQERERILAHFSQRYHQCNTNSVSSEDGVHTLTCALMLLNTDLHGHNIGKRMSCSEFIGNLEGLNGGKDFPRELLKALYSSIKNEKLQWTIDEEELRRSLSELADPNPKSIKRINSCGKPFLDFSQDPNITTYKYGVLVRKIHADPDCKKTPRGKRGWKTFHGILKGMILYLQKEEYKPGKPISEEDLKNAISIHHSLATRASDYNKRPNVFYLRTADWRVFLFQAQNTEQMHSWITRINVVAAMFSAPPFPAAIGSHKKFSRPLLPSAITRLPQEEQVKTHESKFKSMSSSLIEHRTSPPDKKVKGKEVDEFKQKEDYLEFEKSRYGTYAMLLRAKLTAGTEDLEAFETSLFDSAENDEDGLKKSRSSPSLNLDPPVASTKAKCHVSSRSSCRPTHSSNRQKS